MPTRHPSCDLLFIVLTVISISSQKLQGADQYSDMCRPLSGDRVTHRPALFSLGAGIWDVFPGKNHMLQFQAEYKFSASFHGIQPFISALFTHKGAFYCCFGACYDIFLNKYLILTPSFAPGIYLRGGGGKDLGYPLEFRSSIALAVQFCNCHRLGIQFYHISNASLGNRNPGSESLVFYYSIAMW